VVIDRVPSAIAIPLQASFQKAGQTFAYVWNGSKFRLQLIDVSRRSGDRILVSKGLEAGDRIALEDPTVNSE
jgi:HlyD family secretion protein